MRATLTIGTMPLSSTSAGGPTYVVWWEVTDYSPEFDMPEAERRLEPLRKAWVAELWHETMTTHGDLIRWVARRMMSSTQPQLVLDVVEAARVLDQHGVRPS